MAGRPQAEREQRRALEIGAVLTEGPYRRARPRTLRLATYYLRRLPRRRDRRGRGMRGPAILPRQPGVPELPDVAGSGSTSWCSTW